MESPVDAKVAPTQIRVMAKVVGEAQARKQELLGRLDSLAFQQAGLENSRQEALKEGFRLDGEIRVLSSILEAKDDITKEEVTHVPVSSNGVPSRG